MFAKLSRKASLTNTFCLESHENVSRKSFAFSTGFFHVLEITNVFANRVVLAWAVRAREEVFAKISRVLFGTGADWLVGVSVFGVQVFARGTVLAWVVVAHAREEVLAVIAGVVFRAGAGVVVSLSFSKKISAYSFVLTWRGFLARFESTEASAEHFFEIATANTPLAGSVDNGVLIRTFATKF
jgi:hypothetical protein